MLLHVAGQHLLGHVIVVELVVAHGQVDVESQHLTVVQENLLVDINGFLVVCP